MAIDKEGKIVEQMNGKLSVKYEYRDARKIKQQKEISISSEYIEDFNIHQIADFMLSAISLTGHSMKSVLLAIIETSDYVDGITDDLNYLGYGTQAENKGNPKGGKR